MVAATASTVVVLILCGCTGVVGLAHGDPGHDTGTVSSSAAAAAPAATPAVTAPHTAVPQAGGAFSAVNVTFSDQVRQLAASDPRLSTDDIAAALENELSAHHLYAPAAADVHRTLSISVENFSNTLASNASLLGYSFRNVALTGDVLVKGDPALADMPFDIHARARVTSREAGSGGGSLTQLYTRFAVLTVAALRGVEAPSEPLPR
jgi:hypothetical protein